MVNLGDNNKPKYKLIKNCTDKQKKNIHFSEKIKVFIENYVKLIFNSKMIFLIIISSIISNSIIIFQNQKYDKLYQDEEKMILEAIVVGNREEKEYSYIYKIKILHANNNKKYKNTYLYLKMPKKSTKSIQYGDKIKVEGEFIAPTSRRNYGGFDYKEYLKTLKIYGTIDTQKVEIIEHNKVNPIFYFANRMSLSIKQKIDKSLDKEIASLIKGILLGDTSKIEENIQENFRTTNISHILAVSGMHISYIIIGIHLIFCSKVGKRKTRFIVIIFLIFYMLITGFSASIVRAGIMGIISMGAGILYRKNDIWTSISISLAIILIYNPFLITNIGLQFSYLGTIGIIIFHKNIFEILKSIKLKNPKWKYKLKRRSILIIGKIKEILAITFSAQLSILPITIYHFNLYSTYFFLSNLLVSVIIGPIIIIGALFILFSFVLSPIAQLISYILDKLIYTLILISKLSELPFSKLYFATPKVWQIIIYYFVIFILNVIYNLYHSKKLNYTQIRARNLIALIKYKILINKQRYIKYSLIIIILVLFIICIPRNLEIHFIDVGQGDCSFIITPKNQTILIDGGGSTDENFDVGTNTLLPYILDKGFTKIDYIFISHFDQDHIGGLFSILQELKVGKVIIAKQEENSENYKKFLDIVKKKRIKVNLVKMGDKVKIENNLYFDILWPSKDYINENVLNNNSIVCKLCYNNFSALFTGDIEEIAENKILELYKDKENKLCANVLKVAHHGSKTSSKKQILDKIMPQIALIGVGKNNLFNHPSKDTLESLNKCGANVYRTDERGEITVYINKNGKFFVKSIN